MMADSWDPIATGILGAVAVEYQMDELIRRRFGRQDDETWAAMQSENGPLHSFFSKITIAYAFKIIDEKTRDDMHIVRTIRNAFAHSRKIISFDDDLILKELAGASNFDKKLKKIAGESRNKNEARLLYVNLCHTIYLKLLKRRTKNIKNSAYRYQRKTKALWESINPPVRPGLSPRLFPLPSLGGQSDDPKHLTPLQRLGAVYRSEKSGKKHR